MFALVVMDMFFFKCHLSLGYGPRPSAALCRSHGRAAANVRGPSISLGEIIPGKTTGGVQATAAARAGGEVAQPAAADPQPNRSVHGPQNLPTPSTVGLQG